jgi:hypothetical protein
MSSGRARSHLLSAESNPGVEGDWKRMDESGSDLELLSEKKEDDREGRCKAQHYLGCLEEVWKRRATASSTSCLL